MVGRVPVDLALLRCWNRSCSHRRLGANRGLDPDASRSRSCVRRLPFVHDVCQPHGGRRSATRHGSRCRTLNLNVVLIEKLRRKPELFVVPSADRPVLPVPDRVALPFVAPAGRAPAPAASDTAQTLPAPECAAPIFRESAPSATALAHSPAPVFPPTRLIATPR